MEGKIAIVEGLVPPLCSVLNVHIDDIYPAEAYLNIVLNAQSNRKYLKPSKLLNQKSARCR
jgi:hypothetical protein